MFTHPEYGAIACEYFDVEAFHCGEAVGNSEDWGAATAVVAAEKDWTPGPRIIIPISDEGPQCGGGPRDDPYEPIDDADCAAVHHAIPAVWDNRVIVAPVVWLGGSIESLAWKLANGGAPGGQVFDISDIDLATKLADFIRGTCPGDCNSNNTPDDCDIDDGPSRDCDQNRIPDACQDTPDCQDPPNDVADACDISCGVSGGPCDVDGCGNSTDCDNNCVPDECDDPVDCNNNGVQDSCDIADGTSLDCGGFAHNCCVPHGGVGCTNLDIQECVCFFKPACCTVVWDAECVDLIDMCRVGCDLASDGIPDECQAANSPDCDSDGMPDVCELHCGVPDGGCDHQDPQCGAASDCNSNCVPDECEPDEDCNNNGVQDICDLAAGTSEDCNANDVPDECDISGPTSEDCNVNGVADECEIGECQAGDDDCNNNGTPDVCDIYVGTSLDCNENLVPDECDVPPDPWNNWSNDCNSSGIPDECESNEDCQGNCIRDICDIYSGTSEDTTNFNGVPDECEPAILFVDADATGPGHMGTTWCEAFTDLREAISVAEESLGAVTEIRVANGTYTPAGPCGSRGGFHLVEDVAIKGGYAGCGASDPDERDIGEFETILSGDLNRDDVDVPCVQGSQDCDEYGGLCVDGSCIIKSNNDENSYRVVWAYEVGQTAILDGFTITGEIEG
ncbi:MAG: hypothetical protein JSU86_03555, partial [Phycisphaerales bacterium]